MSMRTTPSMTHDGSLRGRRILLTRGSDDSSGAREPLVREGATVLELPAIVIEPPEDFAPFDAALRRLDSYQWVAFPSRNAVKSVFQRLKALNLDPGLVQNLNVGAVGPSTAAELGKQGIAVTCVPEEATGK